jgi:hypothetical protein
MCNLRLMDSRELNGILPRSSAQEKSTNVSQNISTSIGYQNLVFYLAASTTPSNPDFCALDCFCNGIHKIRRDWLRSTRHVTARDESLVFESLRVHHHER